MSEIRLPSHYVGSDRINPTDAPARSSQDDRRHSEPPTARGLSQAALGLLSEFFQNAVPGRIRHPED